MLAQALHIGDDAPGIVVLYLGKGQRLTAATLVKEDGAVVVWVKERPIAWVGSTTGSTVNIDNRMAIWLTALLIIDLVAICE